MDQALFEFGAEVLDQINRWRWAFLIQLTPEIKSRIREYLLPPELHILDQFEALRASSATDV